MGGAAAAGDRGTLARAARRAGPSRTAADSRGAARPGGGCGSAVREREGGVIYRYTGPDTNPWIGIPGGASDIGVAADGWDSGASTWTAQRRQAYANDQVPPSAWSRSPPARTGRRQSRILPAGCRLPPACTAGTSPSGSRRRSAGALRPMKTLGRTGEPSRLCSPGRAGRVERGGVPS
jgi:hypothetical protein